MCAIRFCLLEYTFFQINKCAIYRSYCDLRLGFKVVRKASLFSDEYLPSRLRVNRNCRRTGSTDKHFGCSLVRIMPLQVPIFGQWISLRPPEPEVPDIATSVYRFGSRPAQCCFGQLQFIFSAGSRSPCFKPVQKK
jgi:hypothetical protein